MEIQHAGQEEIQHAGQEEIQLGRSIAVPGLNDQILSADCSSPSFSNEFYGWFTEQHSPQNVCEDPNSIVAFGMESGEVGTHVDGTSVLLKSFDLNLCDSCESIQSITPILNPQLSMLIPQQKVQVQISISKFRIVQREKSSKIGGVFRFLTTCSSRSSAPQQKSSFSSFFSELIGCSRHAEYQIAMKLGDKQIVRWRRSKEFGAWVNSLPEYQFRHTKAFWPFVVGKWARRNTTTEHLCRKCVMLERLLQEMLFEAPTVDYLANFLQAFA